MADSLRCADPGKLLIADAPAAVVRRPSCFERLDRHGQRRQIRARQRPQTRAPAAASAAARAWPPCRARAGARREAASSGAGAPRAAFGRRAWAAAASRRSPAAARSPHAASRGPSGPPRPKCVCATARGGWRVCAHQLAQIRGDLHRLERREALRPAAAENPARDGAGAAPGSARGPGPASAAGISCASSRSSGCQTCHGSARHLHSHCRCASSQSVRWRR